MTDPLRQLRDTIDSLQAGCPSAGLITQAANRRHLRAAVLAIPRRELAQEIVHILRGARGQGEVELFMADFAMEAM